MRTAPAGRRATVKEIIHLVRGYSTAAVLFHHAIAERLGLGPSDHKCLDLIRERGSMTASELAAITGLTSGAVTGVVARLERAGYLVREPDPDDGRKQTLSPAPERLQEIRQIFDPIQKDAAELLQGFEPRQLATIAEFLARNTEFVYRRAALLRAETSLTAHSRQGRSTHAGRHERA